MNAVSVREAMAVVSRLMDDNKDYLVELDARNGDGDLGISMSGGFKAVSEYLNTASEADLGKLLLKCSTVFNEAAPSSLGTILSFGLLGMAKKLKGVQDADLTQLAQAMAAGVQLIMEKAKSKPGEKTILDALCPAVEALNAHAGGDWKEAFKAAADKASEGSENTKEMVSVHGRAAYYGEKSIGLVDGGSVVGKLIFEALNSYVM